MRRKQRTALIRLICPRTTGSCGRGLNVSRMSAHVRKGVRISVRHLVPHIVLGLEPGGGESARVRWRESRVRREAELAAVLEDRMARHVHVRVARGGGAALDAHTSAHARRRSHRRARQIAAH
eukprot:6201687-Pleurochrysis_carterae.AAC.5